jgi:hypothetical protein
MAAQQEQIRNMLRQLEKDKTKEGKKNGKDLKEIQDLMEKTEEDLVNKRITNETLKRQKEITIKLLEAEKAEREQEKDKKRESRTARDIFDKNPPSLEEYQKQKQKEVELLESVPPSLNDFYKEKVRYYFRLLQE